MATDKEKYRYINKVALTRGSMAEKRFAKDTEECHMTDQPGKLAALRLTHYYQMIDRIEHLFRYNPAMAAMLLAVGGVTGVGAKEEGGETQPTPPISSNEKNLVRARPVSKKIRNAQEEDPPAEDFTDEVNNTWSDL